MQFRTAVSGVFAAGLTLVLTLPGCGGAQEGSYVEHRPQPTEVSEAPSAPPVPGEVVEKLGACVRENARDLTTYSHETRFDLDLTAEGTVGRVKLRKSTLQSGAMESCMMWALVEMTIDPLDLPMRSSKPFSGGERMQHSREPLGIAQALGGLVALGPIILVAAGVTVGVYVAVAVTEEVLEAAKRNRRINNLCQAALYRCVEAQLGICNQCHGWCLNYGYWPEHLCPLPN